MVLHLFLLWLLLSQGSNCGCEQKPEINVLAVVNGVKIARIDLSIDTLPDRTETAEPSTALLQPCRLSALLRATIPLERNA